MIDPLADARYSVQHSKRHLDSFAAEWQKFIDSGCCSHAVEFKPPATDVHKIKLSESLPLSLASFAFDAVNNLRLALDQAGFAIATSRPGNKGKDAHFPFGASSVEVQSRRTRRSKDLPPEIFDLMVSFLPYEGGNDLLVAVNKICNSHKHQMITPTAMVPTNAVTRALMRLPGTVVHTPFVLDSVSNEIQLLSVPHRTQPNAHFQIDISVTFANVESLKGQPLFGVVNKMASMIDSILMALEAEARRIGLFK